MLRSDLIQVNFMQPLLRRLQDEGCNTEKLLRASQLHHYNTAESSSFIPLQLLYRLFEEVRQQEGVDSFLGNFDETIRFQGMRDYSMLFTSTTDLLGASQLAIRYAGCYNTGERDRLEIKGPEAKFTIELVDADMPGKAQFVEIHTALLLSFIQHACGVEWAPREIHLPLATAPDLSNYLPEGHQVCLLLNQPHIAFVFPTEVLHTVLPEGLDSQPNELLIQLSHIRGKLEQLFRSTQPGFIPTLAHAASVFDMSPRSLQLLLGQEGTTYSEVLDNWRFSTGVRSVAEGRLTLKEISLELGYLKVQNFHRAFKRWTGTSPLQYREIA